ncbi:MAG TPA: murein L,D-transpeptidase catalytic domain family protein [Gemmatimonadaceae bacterium]|nr:murein L,D-transpeptidase catalytic domain family protein [Gemmatimonadaceae bacterium]
MARRKLFSNLLIGSTAVLFGGAKLIPGADHSGPVLTAATAIVTGKPATTSAAPASPASSLAMETETALNLLSPLVPKLSSPSALQDAFKAYFAYRTEHPDEIKKPYLYFVDYGLASTEARGYVFDMDSLKIVDGPFTVAHGRGSSTSRYGVPTRFGNGSGSAETSLGLYVTKALYPFTGHTGGSTYSSIGLRLMGVSKGFNDLAFARGVVAHGAPYVTASKAGRSEGCPAMEPARAQRLLPKLADGAMVFLFAPNTNWMANDPWVNA